MNHEIANADTFRQTVTRARRAQASRRFLRRKVRGITGNGTLAPLGGAQHRFQRRALQTCKVGSAHTVGKLIGNVYCQIHTVNIPYPWSRLQAKI